MTLNLFTSKCKMNEAPIVVARDGIEPPDASVLPFQGRAYHRAFIRPWHNALLSGIAKNHRALPSTSVVPQPSFRGACRWRGTRQRKRILHA